MLFRFSVLWGLMAAIALLCSCADTRTPNIVVIFIDDMGYADIGPFGTERYQTPNLDRMAAEGMRFTDFQVSSAVCSASRASLLTGCYHSRLGLSGALGPGAEIGIHEQEVTLGELCKQKAYATACFGKWHLGHHPKFLPLQNGFDEYYGLPYSNDMWPYHPTAGSRFPDLPLIQGNRVIDPDVTAEDQKRLTTQYTERAVDFIERHRDRPFLLYLPHSMVHVPLYVSDRFQGRSGQGLFADVVMEIDWSVGQILDALKRNGLDEHTLVIFTSDNGPWLSYGDHAGSSGALREGKGTMFEGGTRVPTLMRWPGKIPVAASCDELASTIDILPTVARLIGAKLPEHRIDGKDIRPLLFGEPNARSPHSVFYSYYAKGQLQAVRDPRWKLHFPHEFRTLAGRQGGTGGQPVQYEQSKIGLELFDLKQDVAETIDVAAQHPEVVERLKRYADQARDDLGDALNQRKGRGVRGSGQLDADDVRLEW